jgi:hypothetical protein
MITYHDDVGEWKLVHSCIYLTFVTKVAANKILTEVRIEHGRDSLRLLQSKTVDV